MIEIKGTNEEIKKAVECVAPTWPTALIASLDPGEWHFVLDGVDVRVWILDRGEA